MALRNILKLSLSPGSTLQKAARSYSSSTKPLPLYKASLPLTSTPWLMLPPDVRDGTNGPTDNYFNILDKSLVKIDRPRAHGAVPPNTKCIGTTRGWVAFTCDSDNSVSLAYPYSEGCSMTLPENEDRSADSVFDSKFECTLAGNPVSKSFALLAVYECNDHNINICTNRGWKKQPGSRDSRPLLAYNRKGNTVYKLQWEKSGSLQIQCWDVLSDNAPTVINTFSFGDDSIDYPQGQQVLNGSVTSSVGLLSSFMCERFSYSHSNVKYLVVGEENERPGPALFLIIRQLIFDEEEIEENGPPSKTTAIHLFRIDLERNKVENVNSLGEQALFVGSNSEPFILSTRDCPGLKSNSIYIADELGVYDLETKCVTPFLSLGDLMTIRPQVYWVAPHSLG